MNDETKAALRASIEKWRANENVTNIFDARVKSTDCPLCEMFNKMFTDDEEMGNCKGCPVSDYTGKPGCENTPYDGAYFAYVDRDLNEFLQHAEAEREFLESLLEERDNAEN